MRNIRYRCECRSGIEREAFVHLVKHSQGVGGNDQGVAIGLGSGYIIVTDRGAGAGLVLYDYRLVQDIAQFFCKNASDAVRASPCRVGHNRSEEHTSELQSLMRISYSVFCLKKKIYHKDTKS